MLAVDGVLPRVRELDPDVPVAVPSNKWFHANSDSGAMTFEAFSKALGQLARSKGQLCVDPKDGWEAAMGACSFNDVMKLEDFGVLSFESFECVVQMAHIPAESDPLSEYVGEIPFGMRVDLTNDPEGR